MPGSEIYAAQVRNQAKLAYNSTAAWLDAKGPAPARVAQNPARQYTYGAFAAHIVMPANAPLAKQEQVRRYGGLIELCEPTLAAREASWLVSTTMAAWSSG